MSDENCNTVICFLDICVRPLYQKIHICYWKTCNADNLRVFCPALGWVTPLWGVTFDIWPADLACSHDPELTLSEIVEGSRLLSVCAFCSRW